MRYAVHVAHIKEQYRCPVYRFGVCEQRVPLSILLNCPESCLRTNLFYSAQNKVRNVHRNRTPFRLFVCTFQALSTRKPRPCKPPKLCIAPTDVTNKISKGILVVVFSRCPNYPTVRCQLAKIHFKLPFPCMSINKKTITVILNMIRQLRSTHISNYLHFKVKNLSYLFGFT